MVNTWKSIVYRQHRNKLILYIYKINTGCPKRLAVFIRYINHPVSSRMWMNNSTQDVFWNTFSSGPVTDFNLIIRPVTVTLINDELRWNRGPRMTMLATSSELLWHAYSANNACKVRGRLLYCGRVPAASAPGCTASEGLLYKLRGLSPRANYTDRAAAAGRRS